MNEDLAETPPATRLLFIGLWTLADREGRLGDRPKRINAALFPFDSFNIDSMLNELESLKFISRYEIDGSRYIQIANFTKHQVPHHKEVASEIPAPPGAPQVTRHPYDVSEQDRQAVFKRDGMRCLKCGSSGPLSLDHIVPLGSGGGNEASNLQTLCKSCNSAKGNTVADYRNVASTLKQDKGEYGASCRSDSLIPDSLNLIPDSPIKNKAQAPAARKRAASFDAKAIELPEWLDAELWSRWVDDRKARKKPISEEAARLQFLKLDELRLSGRTPKEVIEHSIANGYQGLFPPPRASPSAQAVAPPTVPISPAVQETKRMLEADEARWAEIKRQRAERKAREAREQRT